MMVGVKKRFVPFVENGSKRHTIRARRKGKRQIQVGDRLDLYANPRQKTMRLLGRWTCIRIEHITIGLDGIVLGPDVGQPEAGRLLDLDERNALAWADGFRETDLAHAFEEMIAYWQEEAMHGENALPFHGFLNHWKRDDLGN